MAHIKSYTDLEQSKKLMKILPIYSADMNWHELPNIGKFVRAFPYVHNNGATEGILPCWSLAALLDLMICPKLEEYVEGVWDLTAFTDESLRTPIELQDCESAVDACYEMIIKLYELKLL